MSCNKNKMRLSFSYCCVYGSDVLFIQIEGIWERMLAVDVVVCFLCLPYEKKRAEPYRGHKRSVYRFGKL